MNDSFLLLNAINHCVVKALHEVLFNSSIDIDPHVFFLWTETIDCSRHITSVLKMSRDNIMFFWAF